MPALDTCGSPGCCPEWYRITAKGALTTEVMLFDEIGYWGITGQDFITELAAITTPAITLRVNSPGGECYDGIAIYHALKRHPAVVTVCVEGLAASIASVIAMAGDKIVMQPQTRMMVHEASGVCAGTAQDMADLGNLLEGLSSDIAAIYAQRAGGDPATWRSRMLAESWYSAEEAVAAGLADEVETYEARVPATMPAAAVWDPELVRSGIRTAVADADFGATLRAAIRAAVPGSTPPEFPADDFRTAVRGAVSDWSTTQPNRTTTW